MFQFTARCGLKNTVVMSLLKLILMELIILCLVLKKVVSFALIYAYLI